MSDKSSQNEPSMNEILGSIRRIISEDNGQTADAGAAPDVTPDAGEEILDLTEEATEEEVAADLTDDNRQEPLLGGVAAADEGSVSAIRREPILGLHSPEPPVVADAMEEAAAADQPDSAVHAVPAQAEQEMAGAPDEGAHGQATPDEMQQPEMPAPAEPQAAMQPAPVALRGPAGDIVSQTATVATATALGELNRAMDEKMSQLKVGAGDASVSDMVKELLRPMLREWLDENLPVIVERIVRREIQKLVDRAEADE